MNLRAERLGYRLEPLWLRAPGMTHRRFRSILDARGIEGLLCFGSPNISAEFPWELDHYAIVTVGLSINSHLHRVTSHFFNDLSLVLSRLHERGYRRPGLVLSTFEDDRSAHAYTSAYFGWCERVHGSPLLLPVLRIDRVEERPLLDWMDTNRPDAIVIVHLYHAIEQFQAILRKNGISMPGDVGVAAVSQFLEGTGLSGTQQNQTLIGEWAVELLVSRIMHQDFGIPRIPRIELVESEWVEGSSLRRREAAPVTEWPLQGRPDTDAYESESLRARTA
jgi:DNA-binding LacI/PurR family transcriptional regulator